MRNALFAAACLCALSATAAAAQQRNPTAHCNDGTYYYGVSRRLACTHHRGVSEWLARPQAARPLRHPGTAGRGPHAPSGATARCRDRTWSTDPRRANACARHGGVARWMGRH